MAYFNETPDTTLLSKEEKAWVRKLEKVLLSTPKRFGIYTIGDPTLHIFDKHEMESRNIEQEECNDASANLDLASVNSSEGIQGWCG